MSWCLRSCWQKNIREVLKMYQPKIRDDQVHQLYLIKEKTGISMTTLIREAVDEYLEKKADLIKEVFDEHLNEKKRK